MDSFFWFDAINLGDGQLYILSNNRLYNFHIKCIYVVEDYFVIANSADPDEMLYSLFAKESI